MILQGAPGTGKTYSTALLAVGIIDEDDSLDYSDYNAVVKNMKLTKGRSYRIYNLPSIS